MVFGYCIIKNTFLKDNTSSGLLSKIHFLKKIRLRALGPKFSTRTWRVLNGYLQIIIFYIILFW